MAFRSLAILVALVSAVLAQSSNPLIPPNISDSCANYLSSLNNNTQIQSCLSPITTALAAFNPTGNLATCSSSTVDTALTAVCSSSLCPQSTFTAELGKFYASCPNELTSSSPNPQVKLLYDSFFGFVPFRGAICSKNDNGDYCVTKLSNSTSSASKNSLYVTGSSPSVSRRDSNSTPIIVPNATTFANDNIFFLLLQPDMPSSDLCNTCTRNIMTSYIDFESNALYAPNLAHSLLLGGQSNLYNNITSTCGASFLSGAVAAAGGLSQGVMNSAPRVAIQDVSAAVGTILGVAGLVVASL